MVLWKGSNENVADETDINPVVDTPQLGSDGVTGPAQRPSRPSGTKVCPVPMFRETRAGSPHPASKPMVSAAKEKKRIKRRIPFPRCPRKTYKSRHDGGVCATGAAPLSLFSRADGRSRQPNPPLHSPANNAGTLGRRGQGRRRRDRADSCPLYASAPFRVAPKSRRRLPDDGAAPTVR